MHSYYGILPIHLAICNNYLDIVKLLVEKGKANVNEADNKGITPFLISKRKNYFGILKYLKSNGAINQRRNDKKN